MVWLYIVVYNIYIYVYIVVFFDDHKMKMARKPKKAWKENPGEVEDENEI